LKSRLRAIIYNLNSAKTYFEFQKKRVDLQSILNKNETQLNKIEGNIYKLYAIKTAKWFMLIMPIVVLFYNENGLTQFDVFILQGIYSIVIATLEIPTGYFADVVGRKKSLVAGSMLGFGGYAIYSFSYGFTGFLIAEIILGIGASLISGADSAMLYDSLLSQKKEKEYLKLEGRVTSIGNFAEAIAGISGGLLATYSLRMPYYFQTAVAFMAIPVSLSLVEPKVHQTLKDFKINRIIQIIRYAIVENKELRYNIIFSAIIGASTLTMAWFVQPYFKLVQVPLAWYGILWTLLNLSVAITSLYAYKVEKQLGQQKTVFFIALLISGGYLLVGSFQSQWAIGFIFLFYMVRGVATPVLKDYINKMTNSEVRATVLSVRNFLIRILFAIIGPLFGYLNDAYSLRMALTLAGILFLVFGLTSVLLFMKAIRSKPIQ
jgi:MFS family permease